MDTQNPTEHIEQATAPEIALKKFAIAWYIWWWNQDGTDLSAGYDQYIAKNPAAFDFVKQSFGEQDPEDVINEHGDHDDVFLSQIQEMHERNRELTTQLEKTQAAFESLQKQLQQKEKEIEQFVKPKNKKGNAKTNTHANAGEIFAGASEETSN